MALPNTILFKALPNSPNNFRKPNTQIYVNLLFKEMINSLLFANTNKSSNFSWILNAQHPHELWTKEASPTVFLIRISPGTTACIIASVCVCVIGSFGGGVLTGRFNLLDDEDLRYSGDLMGRVKGFEERCCSTVLHQCNHDRCSPLKPAALTNALPVSFPRSLTPPHTSSLTLRYTHTQTRTLANFTAHWLVRPPSVVTL